MAEPSLRSDKEISPISVRRIGKFLAAEVTNIDLKQPLDPQSVESLKLAHAEHGVLVFPNQNISSDDLKRFGRYFGKLTVHPFSTNDDEEPELIVYDNKEGNPPPPTDIWHSDETFRANPPMATVLRAKVVPDAGGDTLFASMSAAYRGLSERMKHYIHGLEALHDFRPFRDLLVGRHRERLRELEDQFPNPWHPVVRVHPVSGRRVLFVNPQFTLRIRDMKEDESGTLLRFLYRQAHIPEYQLRVKWQPHTLVMWDNRSVQHYAAHDYYPARRTMERVTVAGDVPFGVSGRYTPETVAGLGEITPRIQTPGGPKRQFERV